MQKRFSQVFGKIAGWAFALVSLMLCSFGIYLGRFQRWNSWDIVTQPFDLLTDIWLRFRYPLAHLRTFGVSVLFLALLVGLYLVLVSLSHLHREEG